MVTLTLPFLMARRLAPPGVHTVPGCAEPGERGVAADAPVLYLCHHRRLPVWRGPGGCRVGVLQWPVVAVPCEHVRLWLWLWLVVLVAVVVAVAMSVGCGRRCGSEHMLQRRYSAPIPHAHVQWCVRGQRGAHSSTVGELCVPRPLKTPPSGHTPTSRRSRWYGPALPHGHLLCTACHSPCLKQRLTGRRGMA